jgi:hypothetical protein
MPTAVVARAIASRSKPSDVDVSEIVIPNTAQQ